MTSRLVAVTGATGFLGRRLVAQLNATGWLVRVLARANADSIAWDHPAPDIVTGALQDTAALSSLVAGADAVIHAAGLIKARNRAEFFAVNEGGAREVAIAAAGRRLIYVSSLAAREPGLSDYAASKRAGETAVQTVALAAATIVRPPAIYGPGDKETLSLFKAVSGPFVIAPGQPSARVAIAEVDDVAQIIVEMLDAKSATEIVTIGGDKPEGYSWRELVAVAARAVGHHPTLIETSSWLLKLAGATSEIVGQWRDTPPIFTLGKAREALHPDWSVSMSEQGSTAHHPYVALADGFAQTVDWYRTKGWLR